MKNKHVLVVLLFFLVISISCSITSKTAKKTAVNSSTSPVQKDVEKTVTQIASNYIDKKTILPPGGDPSIGELFFCSSFDENTGDPINPIRSFPANTMSVYMVFTFENMQDGMVWSLDMYRDDYKMKGVSNGKWEDGENGWVAYDLSEDFSNNPLAGKYTIQILIGDQVMQEGGFNVALPLIVKNSFPSFGPVQFAPDITDDISPVDPGTSFEEGIDEVFAVLPYSNMQSGQACSREWLLDDEVTASKDFPWDEQEDGITYFSLHTQGGMKPGKYTLNLYIGDQIARSSSFEILAAPTPIPPEEPTPVPDRPSNPEDLIDPQVMPT
jgi:hypothetical protein